MVSSIGLQFGACRVDRSVDAGLRARRRTASELKRALSAQISKLIKETNEALKIPSDVLERCLVEV
jgi:hypothetical protein